MSIDSLAETIEDAGLGPAVRVELFTTPDGQDAVVVELDPTERVARTLLRWLDLITVWDMVAGKFRATDRVVRLNLRGQFPGGLPVVVVAPFDERTDSDRTDLIYAQIEAQRPHDLINRLASMETERGRR